MKLRTVFLLLALAVATTAFAQQNKRIAILETVDKEESVPYGVKLIVRSKLGTMISSTHGYEAYDRVDIASIMSEHEFQRTGLVSDLEIRKLGEMTGADYILVAEVADIGNSAIFITAKILNVETARVERTADIQSSTSSEELENNCRLLANELLNVNATIGVIHGELKFGRDRYLGEYKDGLPHGTGKITYGTGNQNGSKFYDGEWRNGKMHGTGTFVWVGGERYVGTFNDGTREGYGTYHFANGDVYEGEFQYNNRQGRGKITYAPNNPNNCNYYDGEWYEGKKDGKGTLVWVNGERYEGDWKRNNRHGNGTYFFPNGDYEVASYVNDKKEGHATYYSSDGSVWKGSYVNDKREGNWDCYIQNKLKRTWLYKNGEHKRTIRH